MKNIFFIGPRGSGKTTTGKALAKRLQLPFQDTDEVLEKTHLATVEDIVRTHGWDGFRSRESEVLRQVCSRQGQVIATGGGIILSPANRDLISGVVFYLQASEPVLFARLSQSPNSSRRPPLYTNTLREEIKTSLKEREHLYLTLAVHVLDATKPLTTILEDIIRLYPELSRFQK